MRKIFFFLFVCLVILHSRVFSQTTNTTCANASQFCDTGQYPAGTNAGSASGAASWGCLGSQPNPAWLTIPISQSGSLNIVMSATYDIDFICWGPFTSPTGNCGSSILTSATQVPNSPSSFGCYPISSCGNTIQGCSYSGSATEQLLIPNAQAGEYYVLLITNYSNQSQQINITNNNSSAAISGTLSSLSIVNNGPICEGQNAMFTAVGATTYTWFGSAGFTSPNANPQTIPNVQFSNTGTYTVIGTSHSCTGTATSYLQVKPNPTITVSKGGDFCVGKSCNLLVNGAYTYTWSGPNGYSFQGSNPVFANNSSSLAGLYYVTGEMIGCSTTTDIALVINPLPPVLASSTGSVCQGSSFSLTASGATSYTWTGPVWNTSYFFTSHEDTIAVNVSQNYMTGNYYLEGKDQNGCINYDTVYQTVRSLPLPIVNDGAACYGSPLTLSAFGGNSYQWSGPHGFSSNLQSPVINNSSSANSGIYNVIVTNTYGCSQTAAATGTVYALPQVQVLGSIDVCQGKTFTFTGFGANEYRWLASYGEVLKGPVFTISSVAPELQVTYTLVGIDDHACANTTFFYPIVKRLPQAKMTLEKAAACVPFCSTMNLEKQSSNIQSVAWKFSDGEAPSGTNFTQYKKCITKAGVYTYTVNLLDSVGCANKVIGKIDAYPLPAANFSYNPEKPNVNNNKITFYDISKNAEVTKWNWDFYTDFVGHKKDTSSVRYLQNPTRVYPDVGSYLVFLTVTSENGCKDSVAKYVTIEEDPTFFIPDTFTPNDDGINDVFMPKAVAIKQYEMQIFNRWGALIFSSKDITEGWTGKISDEVSYPEGDYIYKFTVTDDNMIMKEYRGHFTLMK